jgi:hypothetical protein
MKFALHFGNTTFPAPEGARRLVRLAEAAGFDSVFAVEHVVFPDSYTSVYRLSLCAGRSTTGRSIDEISRSADLADMGRRRHHAAALHDGRDDPAAA